MDSEISIRDELLSEQSISEILNGSKDTLVRAVEIKKTNNVVIDSPKVFKLYFLSHKTPFGIVHLSPPSFPESIKESYDTTLRLHASLGQKSKLLVPRFCSYFNGRSYTYTKYFSPIITSKLGALQRKILRKHVLNWLASFEPVSKTVNQDELYRNLEQLYNTADVTTEIKSSLKNALQALNSGSWRPCHIPDHNDIWYGNVLTEKPSIFCKDFYIIDCGSANTFGYGIQDLLTSSTSFGYGHRKTAEFIAKFIKLNGMNKNDVLYQYLAGMAHLRQNLNQFPMPRFIQKLTHSHLKLVTSLSYIKH